ncbi:RHTO0S09e05094g1_1 [Rhodotorula toruloides]|uniref:RHTO0S09e05094g1_1 n=1 Tax=Rhodotorula toruloides TaxID=5286 RepID=A0A061B3I6_RHOTO|nr:RHTO0S09e05094g1_1 [Rhodotorula toruloides]
MAPPPKRSLVTRFTTNNYVAGMLPTLAGFMFGCDLISMSGQVSNPAYLEQFNHPNSNLQGAITAAMPAGSFGGALINSYLSDKIGRKWCIIISGWVWVLGCIIQAASFNVRTLVAGRVVAGLAVGLGSAIVTIYQAEITRPAIRGRIVATQQLAITFSELLQYFVSFGCSYIANDASFRMPWALQAIPGLILGILMFAFPESPRWLMDHGREEQALQILADVHAEGETENELVQLEYLEIKRQVEFDRTLAARSYLDLLKPEYFRRTFLACITQMWSQLSGNNVMMYYVVYVFQSAGIVGRRGGLIASGVQYALHFVATIPAVIWVDKWGRRPTMMIGMFAMGCCLFAVGAIQATLGQPLHSGSSATTTWTIVGHTSARNAVIVLSYIFVMLFSMTYGPCSWIFPSEIHHMRVRGKAVSAATATNWMFNFALAWSTPPAFRNIQYKTYFVYGTFCICAAINVFFMFPETKGRTLEEMDDLFAAGHAFSAWRLSSVPKKTLAEVEAEVADSDMRSEGDNKHTMNHIEKSSSDHLEQAGRHV